MKVCVEGLWHLGSVTASCLSKVGFKTIGFDSNCDTIDNLKVGIPPILEPGLEDLIYSGIKSKNLFFSANKEDALKDTDVLWVCYDTPVDINDNADSGFVIDNIKQSLSLLKSNALVLISSQLPVGSVRSIEEYAKNNYPNKKISFACLPENLRLGNAIEIFLRPDRLIVGYRDESDKKIIEEFLKPFNFVIEWMSTESAEMTKHAINAFLATSIVFANEISGICEVMGADAKEVERGLKTEKRIGPGAYLSPGGPYAGGTLARDINFIIKLSKQYKLNSYIANSVSESNDHHKLWINRKLKKIFKSLDSVQITIWGLTYKPGTDTLRRSQSVELGNWLLKEGAILSVYDPNISRLPSEWENKVTLFNDSNDSIKDSDVLIIGSPLEIFKKDIDFIASKKNKTIVIDQIRFLEKNLNKSVIKKINYYSVGMPDRELQ